MTSKKRVLVVGGTGYLGQHVLHGFSEIEGITATTPFGLAFTHHPSPPPQALLDAFPQLLHFHVTGHGFQAISRTLAGSGFIPILHLCKILYIFFFPDVVVNCAALSIPRACEMDPAAAMSVNVPSSLVNWLSSFEESSSLLIHLSTDQVYEGVKSFYKEDDETAPVNVYGKSKVAAEQFITENFSNLAILSSSIIFGPLTISPVPKDSPSRIDGVPSKGNTSEFFHDEFRCPIYVKDVVAVILALSKRWISDSKQTKVLLNVGGPDRVSRLQMAEIVADVRGYSPTLIKSVSASSVDRGVMSPA
ncbi:dTDP-4-dehydrorhamnose reductase-like [Pyrus x bretschneideri]|uniref:dTDP-4-dehydrorhamnose reductase-like n=1 Tax=Pyrus x bretschneideri TaxID=225117 RepID=UPI00202FB542|nr:dTDP-4-dehydrorhamnose reductase-like [Pyrus x bretschneideri]